MVDGKVCSEISESLSCKCYDCGATTKEMNKIDACLRKPVQESRYHFGLSPLHSWIWFFEYFIHLSHRVNIKKWQVRPEKEKKMLEDRKLHDVQTKFRKRIGFIEDEPRSGVNGK